jgi:hypothetical protein
MGIATELEAAKSRVLADWVQRLEHAHVLMGPREAVAAALDRWLAHLGSAADGDTGAARELYKLVAFHARALGADGRPASAALMQALLLQDALETVLGAQAALRNVMREICRVVADAHALGHSERAKNRHHLEIRDFSPVVRLGERTVLGFLLGAMDSDLIDAMAGRLLREAARSSAERVVLDTFGAARDNETFHRTIQAFLRSEVGCRVHLTLTGLRDPEATRASLAALGCNMERVHFEPDVNSAIATTLEKTQ